MKISSTSPNKRLDSFLGSTLRWAIFAQSLNVFIKIEHGRTKMKFINILLPTTILFSCFAYGSDLIDLDGAEPVKTLYGTLSITGDFQQEKLLLNGKVLKLPDGDGDFASLGFVSRNSFPTSDAILISDSSGASCQLYRFVTLGDSAPIITPAFGTCDDGPKISSKGDQVT